MKTAGKVPKTNEAERSDFIFNYISYTVTAFPDIAKTRQRFCNKFWLKRYRTIKMKTGRYIKEVMFCVTTSKTVG